MPSAQGFWPDCGAITAAIRLTTGKEPDIVLGKPCKYMGQAAIRRSGFRAEQVMMVGDRAETDVLLAKENGMCSTLVLTGATPSEHAKESGADLIVDDLGQLAKLLLANKCTN
jgi:NagD protein